MNDTPCRTCNQLHQAYYDAWKLYRSDPLANPDLLNRTLRVYNDHQTICDVIHGSWYLGLWSTAIVQKGL
jgi:hypothetical protein